MKKEKLIHILSNEVSLNDVVNVVLAVGGTAICATSVEEVEEVATLANGMIINIGMPTREKYEAMKHAGRKANEKGIPIVLDPVGAGVSNFRKEILEGLMKDVSFRCIKGNHAEIAYLCGKTFQSRGVEGAAVTLEEADMRELSKKTGGIIVATGEVNLVASGEAFYRLPGGSPVLKKITGSGCMLSGALAVSLAGEKREDAFEKVCGMLKFFNESARRAESLMREGRVGFSSFKTYLIDALSEGETE